MPVPVFFISSKWGDCGLSKELINKILEEIGLESITVHEFDDNKTEINCSPETQPIE